MQALVSFLLLATILLGGCTGTGPTKSAQYPSGQSMTAEIDEQRAKHYLAVLKKKKQRFQQKIELHEYLLARKSSYQDRQLASAGLRSASLCNALADSEWADSVMYGQDFEAYQNHVNAVSRCFQQ
jgi:hypothetical protein